MNKKNKARCKKPFSIVKMTKSRNVNNKAPYNEVDNETEKQPNFQKNSFFTFMCSDPSPWLCNNYNADEDIDR